MQPVLLFLFKEKYVTKTKGLTLVINHIGYLKKFEDRDTHCTGDKSYQYNLYDKALQFNYYLKNI